MSSVNRLSFLGEAAKMRRTRVLRGLPSVLLLLLPLTATGQRWIHVDHARQIARADLDYTAPVTRSEEGMPIGNGRMGTLVWTTPTALKTQINRVDVHAMDSTTFSFPRADSDYGYGCGFVDINVAGAGSDVFTGTPFHQHLSVYDGLMTAQGANVTARALAWPDRDVIAIEIDDQRAHPSPVNIDLRMLRYQAQYTPGKTAELAKDHSAIFHTKAHTATSTLAIRGAEITLTQQFREGNFYDSSALAIAVIGRTSHARYLNETTVQLSATPARGPFMILIGSAASADPAQDAATAAIAQVTAAKSKTFAGLQKLTADWWHNFWDKGSVYMHSASGQADFVEANYDYFLYLMGASSRGAFPPRFGGMLWFTNGDLSRWGSQYWWANTSAYYSNLMPANRLDLMDPMFKMYAGMYDNAAIAAQQQWGSQGIWIPETIFFNGPEKLPDDIGKELQDLMLVLKPFDRRLPQFDWYAQNKNRHSSRWNFRGDGKWEEGHYVFSSKGNGIFGSTTHILGVASRIANLAWQRYEFTGDETWLRDHAYPFIKGGAEFYRNFPNLQVDEQGVYHINHTNSGESAWNSRDAPYEVACMHMIFPLAIRASEILGVDADLRSKWQQISDHLTPARANAVCGTGSEIAINRPYGAFVYRGPGAIDPIGPQPELKERFLGFNRLGSFIDAAGDGGAQIFRNRLRLREGPGAIDAEHIAGLASGIHLSLLNSHPELPAAEPMSLFNAWPKDWDAAFTLLARGAFLVSSAQRNGSIPLVEISAQSGGTCALVNPWPGREVTLYRNGRKADAISGETLTFPTAKGETIVLVPAGTTPAIVNMN
jgi:hypothetical protein